MGYPLNGIAEKGGKELRAGPGGFFSPSGGVPGDASGDAPAFLRRAGGRLASGPERADLAGQRAFHVADFARGNVLLQDAEDGARDLFGIDRRIVAEGLVDGLSRFRSAWSVARRAL